MSTSQTIHHQCGPLCRNIRIECSITLRIDATTIYYISHDQCCCGDNLMTRRSHSRRTGTTQDTQNTLGKNRSSSAVVYIMIITTSESHKSKQKLPGCFLYTYLGLIETDPSSHLTEGAYTKNAGKNKNRNIAPPEEYTHRKRRERSAGGRPSSRPSRVRWRLNHSASTPAAGLFYSLKNMGNAISDRKRNHRGIKRV